MKHSFQILSVLVLGLSPIFITGCSKSGDADDNPGTSSVKSEDAEPAGVTIDAATQARIGLQMIVPSATQWLPKSRVYGMVLDPSILAAALSDLETAKVAADASDKELVRQKKLSAENNASARALETAQAAAAHDDLALASERAKFKANWGSILMDQGPALLDQFDNNQTALVRLDLPAGETLTTSPATATVFLATSDTNQVSATFFDSIPGLDSQTQGQSFLFLVKDQALPPNAAVTALLQTADKPLDGVIVPDSAVLRYEGLGWVYTQTETNQFLREAIPLDYPTTNGWFVPQSSPITNRIVITGAQTVLSAELSGGSFNTGERD